MKKENYQNTISAKKFVKLTVCIQSSKCLIHTSINVKNWWCQWISFWLEIRVIIKSILSHPWYPSKKLWFYYQSEKNEKKGPIWLIQKNWVFRNRQFSNFFAKISEIGPWIRRIDYFLFIVRAVHVCRRRRRSAKKWKQDAAATVLRWLSFLKSVSKPL